MKVRYTRIKTIIYDSYLMTNVKKQVKDIINERVDMDLKTTRSMKSYIRETKAHNRLYKLGLFRKHTKNCDLEENIKWWKEIVYFIIGF
jgi:hypothetical protein